MNNFDKNIQELLHSHTEQPSADCWNKIASQLDALQTPNSNTGSSAQSGGNASSFSQFVGSISGKIVSAVVGAAAVGGIIALVMVNSPAKDVQKADKSAVVADKTQNEPAILNEEKAQYANNADVSSKENKHTVCENISHSPNENKDTNIADNRNVSTPATVQNAANQTVQSGTENTEKVETVSQTDNKTQPKTKESRKKFFADKSDTAPVEETISSDAPNKIEPPKFTIPNVFTPNGDNVNDYFVIEKIEQLSENQLYISNRYGSVVYEKSNYQNNWGAENLPDGVYFYIFTYVYQGTQFMRSGSVTVRR